jgi:hypothetical protein
MSDEATNNLRDAIDENHALLLALVEADLNRGGVRPASEQEIFYGRVNHFTEQHAEEINVGVSVVRYEFWKTLFRSEPGKIIFMLILIGLSALFGPSVAAWIWASAMVLMIPLLIVFTVVVIIVGCIMGAMGKSTNAKATIEGEPLYSSETGEPLYTNHKSAAFYVWVVVVTIVLCVVIVFCF